ncbi:MAG: hypothetical protein KAY24_04830 [Candidatus Eisenbacteria sp.]|nr:hypothetical protein [Candidatus Eisenbacteria bacterium]
MARMTKEELREDPILERVQQTLNFVQSNARWIALGVAAVIILIAGVIMINRSRVRAETDAAQLLSAGQQLYLQGNYAESESQLQQLLDMHGASRAAAQAWIYLADGLAAQERREEALAAYESAGGRGTTPIIRAAAARGRGTVLEDLEQFGEASKAYEEAAGVETIFQVDDLLGAARTALQAADPARAQVLLEQAQAIKATGRSVNRAKIQFYLSQAEAALSK